MNTASDIIQAIGRDRIKSEFDVGDRLLQIYAKDGLLPASWFDGCEKMAGTELPRRLFTFKGGAK